MGSIVTVFFILFFVMVLGALIGDGKRSKRSKHFNDTGPGGGHHNAHAGGEFYGDHHDCGGSSGGDGGGGGGD